MRSLGGRHLLGNEISEIWILWNQIQRWKAEFQVQRTAYFYLYITRHEFLLHKFCYSLLFSQMCCNLFWSHCNISAKGGSMLCIFDSRPGSKIIYILDISRVYNDSHHVIGWVPKTWFSQTTCNNLWSGRAVSWSNAKIQWFIIVPISFSRKLHPNCH